MKMDNRWNFDQLRSFATAVDAGSFSAAARRLGRAQSMISTHVAMLEADFGIDLFDRSRRTPVLTAAGSALLDHVREILNQCERMEQRALSFAIGEEAEFRLALDESVPYTAQIQVFEALAERFPHGRVRIVFGTSAEVQALIGRGEAQLGFAFESSRAVSDAVNVNVLGAVPLALAVADTHPLAAVDGVQRTDLARYRQLVVRFPGHETGSPRLSPIYWETNSSYTALDLAARGVGFAVVPLTFAGEYSLPQGLRIVRLDGLGLPELSIAVLWKRGHALTAIQVWFTEQMREVVAKV